MDDTLSVGTRRDDLAGVFEVYRVSCPSGGMLLKVNSSEAPVHLVPNLLSFQRRTDREGIVCSVIVSIIPVV